MSIVTTEIQSLGGLIDLVTPADPDPISGRHRDSGVYRGCVEANAPLVTAHFATMGPQEGDRVVWRLEWKLVHKKSGLPPLALLIEDLDRAFGREKPLTRWRLFSGDGIEPFACLLDPPALYVIRAADVRRIRDQLDLVGVSERRLFPDLDGVAVEIYRYYS